MVQGENVNLWRENQVMSLAFLVALVILAVSSQSGLSVLQEGQICFPFIGDMFASLLSHRIWRLPQRVFLACLAVDRNGISL